MSIALPLPRRSWSTAHSIILYSLVVVAIEILLITAMNRVGPASSWATPLMIGIMWTPALVAIGVQLATERTLRGFGWKPKGVRYLGLAYIIPFIYGGVALLLAQALGGGSISFERWASGAGRWGLPEHALFGMLIQMTLFMVPGLVMGLGEEIGWRGYLAPKLAQFFGFWGVVNVSYVIWLAFHLPGMFMGGYHGQGTPLWYSLVCFAALLYPGTVLMTWLRYRSGSLWPSAFYHAAHNLFIQMMWNSAFQRNELSPWLIGEFGALLPIILGAMVAALIWKAGVPAVLAERNVPDRDPA